MINSFQFPRHLGTAITSSRVDLTVCCVFVHPERWTGANNAWEHYHGVQITVNACDCLPIHEGCVKSDIESIIMTLRGRKTTTTNAQQPRVRRLPRKEFNPKPHREAEPQSVPRNRTRNRAQSAPGSRKKIGMHRAGSDARRFGGAIPPTRPSHRDLVQTHTPSTAFRHLPPNSARFSYVTEGALFISAQLSTDAVSALRKVRVLIRLWKQSSAQART